MHTHACVTLIYNYYYYYITILLAHTSCHVYPVHYGSKYIYSNVFYFPKLNCSKLLFFQCQYNSIHNAGLCVMLICRVLKTQLRYQVLYGLYIYAVYVYSMALLIYNNTVLIVCSAYGYTCMYIFMGACKFTVCIYKQQQIYNKAILFI